MWFCCAAADTGGMNGSAVPVADWRHVWLCCAAADTGGMCGSAVLAVIQEAFVFLLCLY